MKQRVFFQRVCLFFGGLFVAFGTAVAASAADNQTTDIASSDIGSPAAAPRQPWTKSRITGTPDPPPPYQVEPPFPKLTFTQPLDLGAAPGLDRLFIAEQSGKIFSFPNDPAVSTADLVIDLKQHRPELTAVYSFTFHPQFAQNHFVFVCYITASETPDGTHVSRFTMSQSDPPVIDPTSEVPVIQWWSGGHNGCSLKFGPDGYLYISTGDGGAPSPPDPLMAGQDVTNLLSAILRIDVDQTNGTQGYQVPPDNPLIGIEGARPEIWAYGFRNPWRMSFDRVSGNLWAGDVGWQLWEMIYRVERGGNYGWPVMEGPQPALPESPRGPTPILPPTVSHPHSEAASITGGYVYHGSRLPDLKGTYVYGDFQTGTVWGLRHDGQQVTEQQVLARTPLQLVSFGEDAAGEIYLVDYQRTQQIYQLTPSPVAGKQTTFPSRLSDTGLFDSVIEETPAAGVTEYQINAAQWADHAVARRWLALPGDRPVSVEPDGGFMFPDGAVLAKTVSMEMERGVPTSSRRLETQILHREQGSWRPYTYIWNEQQTDADLAPATGSDVTLKIQDSAAPGGLREQSYRFAARTECQLCHNAWVDKKTSMMGVQSASPLAMSLQQLNRSSSSSGASQNQLVSMQQQGWIQGSVPEKPEEAPAFVNPYDESCELDRRVRSYLHVNCAHCHQPHAGGSATIELTWDVKLSDAKLLNVRPAQGSFGISHGRLVAPADPMGSVLHYRMAKTGSGRMPRLGSAEVDETAVSMIHDWIAAMPVTTDPDSDSTLKATDEEDDRAIASVMSTDASDHSAAIRQLTASTRGALRLSQLVQQNRLNPAVRQAVLTATAEHPQAEVRDLFERFLPVSLRQKRLGTSVNTADILAMSADAERGRQLFFREGAASCRGCHRVAGIGETLGPELTLIGKKYPPREMLVHLLEPSKLIDTKFVPWVLETKDGLVHTGLLVEKTAEHVLLKNAQNKEVRVASADVETLVSQQKSLMPELLLRDLTAQQAADLLAYLCSLK